MNGFLVIAACDLDDVPVAIFSSMDEAKACAEKVDFDGLEDTLGVGDISRLICVKVLQFLNGLPVGKAEVVRTIEE